MATITQRNGRYRAQVRLNDESRSKTFSTKGDAQRWAALTEKEILDRVAGKLPKKTLADALTRYADTVSSTKKGERWERIRLARFGREKIAKKQIADVTAADMAEIRDEGIARGLKGSSVAREFKLWGDVFETARREWGWIKTNPCRDVRMPRQSQPRKRLIADSERDAICAALGWVESSPVTKKQEVAAIFLLALETGMRAGEINALEWPRISLASRVVAIAESKTDVARDVALSPRAIEILELLRSDRIKVFTVSAESRDKLFRDARDSLNLDCTFHDSRHTAATRIALSGKLTPWELCRQFGWKNMNQALSYFNASAESIAMRLRDAQDIR